MFTLARPRSRNRRRPCQSLASPNRGSTHTARLRIAFWYAGVVWYARTRSRYAAWKERVSVRPWSLAVQAALTGQA